MSDRDELADDLADSIFRYTGVTTSSSKSMADELLAAGYRKPRTITTKQEVEALPDGSVIRDGAGDVTEKRGGVWCSYETAPMTGRQLAKYMPIEVLWEPQS